MYYSRGGETKHTRVGCGMLSWRGGCKGVTGLRIWLKQDTSLGRWVLHTHCHPGKKNHTYSNCSILFSRTTWEPHGLVFYLILFWTSTRQAFNSVCIACQHVYYIYLATYIHTWVHKKVTTYVQNNWPSI